MNNYFIDPSFTGVSNGSQEAPYKNFTALIAAGIVHPCTIALKRGTVLVENALFGASLKNTSGTMSYITAYGEGHDPVWFNSTVFASSQDGSYNFTGQHITSRNTRNLTISNIHFKMRANNVYAPILTALPIETIWVRLEIVNETTEPVISANVYVNDCQFTSAIIEGTSRRSNYEAVLMIVANNSTALRANFMGVTGCHFYGVSRGITIQGNHSYADDPTNNATGTYYSRGVRVENCSFVRCGRGAVLFQGVESANSAETVDEFQSYVKNCNYSRYRWDSMNDDDSRQAADAAFWTWRCNRILFKDLFGGGSYSLNLDCELLDFDYLSWDCVADGCISYNNSALILIMAMSSATATGGARSAYNSSYTQDQWYYTRRNGQGGHVVKNCVSYNDGIDFAVTSFIPYGAFVKNGVYGTYDITIKNCLCIDTVSVNTKAILGYMPGTTTAGLAKYTFTNNVFVFPYLKGASVFNTIAGIQEVAGTIFTDNVVYTRADNAALAANIGQAVLATGTKYTYPNGLLNIPRKPPQNLVQAKALIASVFK